MPDYAKLAALISKGMHGDSWADRKKIERAVRAFYQKNGLPPISYAIQGVIEHVSDNLVSKKLRCYKPPKDCDPVEVWNAATEANEPGKCYGPRYSIEMPYPPDKPHYRPMRRRKRGPKSKSKLQW